MPMRPGILPLLRQLHLYLGIFTAPAILFFAFTGVLQTFNLHEPSRNGNYRPAKWILVVAELHKKQTAEVPLSKVQFPKLKAKGSLSEAPVQGSFALKIFFLLVGASLFVSTLSGYYLSWKYRRSRLIVVALTLAGIVTPLVMILV